MSFRTLKLRRDKNCPVCGDRPTVTQLIDYEAFCGLKRGEGEASVTIPEMTVYELKAKMDRKDDFVLLDVREPHEYEIAKIPGSRLIPVGQLEGRLSELEPFKEKEIVAHCQRGGRSARAVELLLRSGFKKVWNVVGGITEWSNKIDPSVPKY
jgi:adenylyltransferase/sulfurtransferase